MLYLYLILELILILDHANTNAILYYTILYLYYVVRYHTILYERYTIQYYIVLRLVPILVLYFVTLMIHLTLLYYTIRRPPTVQCYTIRILYLYCTLPVLVFILIRLTELIRIVTPYYSILYHIGTILVSYYTMLHKYYTIPYKSIFTLYHAILYNTILYHPILY